MQVDIYHFKKNTPYLVAKIRVKDDAEALRVCETWKLYKGWAEVRAYEVLTNHPLNHTTRAIIGDDK